MTNFEYVKTLGAEEAALVIIKAVDECALYHPFLDSDDRPDLKGNPCFERFKDWLNQERVNAGGKENGCNNHSN